MTPSPRQSRILWFALTALAVAILCALLGVLIWTLGQVLHCLSAVLMPVVLALILAYILDPVVEFFVRKKVPRLRAIVMVFALGLVVVLAVFASVVPGLVAETRELIDDLPQYTVTLQAKTHNFLEHSSLGRQLPGLWQMVFPPNSVTQVNASNSLLHSISTQISMAETNTPVTGTNSAAAPPAAAPPAGLAVPPRTRDDNASDAATGPDSTNALPSRVRDGTPNETPEASLSDTVAPQLTQAVLFVAKWLGTQLGKVTTWVEFLIGLVLVPVFLFYFLLEKERISRHWTDYVPFRESKARHEIIFIINAINDCMIVFFRGQVLVALCVGALLTVAYLILGLNYAVLIGLVAAVLGVIPYVGAAISFAFALLVATVQFGDGLHPLLVLCIAAVVKLLEDFIISPKIIGDRAGLHPLAIILAVMVGAAVFGGILGAMLAIPLTVVLRTLMFRYVWKKAG